MYHGRPTHKVLLSATIKDDPALAVDTGKTDWALHDTSCLNFHLLSDYVTCAGPPRNELCNHFVADGRPAQELD